MVMVVADGVVTNILVHKDIARESNPFLVGIAGDPKLIIIKIAGVLVAAFILWDVNRRHPGLAFWLSFFFLLVYCGIVGWNTFLLVRGMLF